jgi:hypothetical protein
MTAARTRPISPVEVTPMADTLRELLNCVTNILLTRRRLIYRSQDSIAIRDRID